MTSNYFNVVIALYYVPETRLNMDAWMDPKSLFTDSSIRWKVEIKNVLEVVDLRYLSSL